MKRFILFAGSEYYPAGGWFDVRTSADTTAELVAYVARMESSPDWWHIVDSETMKIVEAK